MAYADFTFCLQNELEYLQRVISDTASYFVPLDEAIHKEFIPDLLRIASYEV